mmetsp:Transcript_12111/g.28332  ORF Transcript_12111/g.28332 Transcript_12111/m.28332 type:complete len:110 (+) Transcript_12111:337-666(+)
MHAIGHNLGLKHSMANGEEFGECSSLMGDIGIEYGDGSSFLCTGVEEGPQPKKSRASRRKTGVVVRGTIFSFIFCLGAIFNYAINPNRITTYDPHDVDRNFQSSRVAFP